MSLSNFQLMSIWKNRIFNRSFQVYINKITLKINPNQFDYHIGDDIHIPLYTGCKPTEIEFNQPRPQTAQGDMYCDLALPSLSKIFIPANLQKAAENQVEYLLDHLTTAELPNEFDIEIWPALGYLLIIHYKNSYLRI